MNALALLLLLLLLTLLKVSSTLPIVMESDGNHSTKDASLNTLFKNLAVVKHFDPSFHIQHIRCALALLVLLLLLTLLTLLLLLLCLLLAIRCCHFYLLRGFTSFNTQGSPEASQKYGFCNGLSRRRSSNMKAHGTCVV